MNSPKGYNGYTILDRDRALLDLAKYIRFPEVVFHHITWDFGVTKSYPPFAETAKVVGIRQDNKIQALVVSVNGDLMRPDGRHLHCTFSLDRSLGAKPVDSNKLFLMDSKFIPLTYTLRVKPEFFPF